MTFSPGYGLAASGLRGVPPATVDGQLQLSSAPPAAAIPGLATRRFLAASNASVGSTVQTDVNGAIISVKIVAAVTTFPTVSASGGALIVDLGTLQDILTGSALAGPGDAMVAGHAPRPDPARAGRQPAAGLRRHERGRGGVRAARQPAVDRPAAGPAGRRHRRRGAGHHRLLRQHRGRRAPAARGERAAGRARRAAALRPPANSAWKSSC